MKRFFAAALAALMLLLTACAPDAPIVDHSQAEDPAGAADPAPSEETPPAEPEEPTPPPDPRQEAIDSLLASMTVEEKVGQLFFVRCPEFDAVADISTYHLGGYLLFGRDFKDKSVSDVTDLLETFQAMSEIPLLIGVDEEGGTVVRVSSNPNLAPEGKFPSPQRLYAQGGLEAIAQDAASKSALLLGYGINVNFAPVADVSTDPADFIYDRSFGQDAQATAEYVTTVVEQMDAAGIGSVLKHFPGYGNNVDTHTGIAVDQRSLDSFRESDFVPFTAGIAAGDGTTAVLVSHNIMTAVDDTLPASLSPAVHDLLRTELSFDGVAMTDDLAMEAVASYAQDGAVAVLALQAGNDLIITTDYRTQIPQVLQAVEDGTLSPEVIETACRRVLTWKQALGLLE